jgi:hypothetical protein
MQRQYLKAVAALEAAQRRFDATERHDREAYGRASREVDKASRRVARIVLKASALRARAASGGIGSPLHQAVIERFSRDVVAELVARALILQWEREQLEAERAFALPIPSRDPPRRPSPARSPKRGKRERDGHRAGHVAG